MNDDYIELRNRAVLGIDVILEHLGITYDNGYMARNDQLTGTCPCHEGADNRMAFSLKHSLGLWCCFTHNCHEEYGGGIVGLIKGIKKIDTTSALQFIKVLLPDNTITTPTTPVVQTKKEKIDYWKAHIEQPEITLPKLSVEPSLYIISRGISREIVERYNIRTAEDGNMKGRAIVPIKNINGRVVGYTGRCVTTDSNKWLHSKGLYKKQNLFNIENAKNSKDVIILVEGPLDVLKLEMAGIHNSVAVMGNNICYGQIDILSKANFTEVIVALDNDEAGRRGAEAVARKCEKNLMRVQTVSIEGSAKDWGELSVEEIRRYFL